MWKCALGVRHTAVSDLEPNLEFFRVVVWMLLDPPNSERLGLVAAFAAVVDANILEGVVDGLIERFTVGVAKGLRGSTHLQLNSAVSARGENIISGVGRRIEQLYNAGVEILTLY